MYTLNKVLYSQHLSLAIVGSQPSELLVLEGRDCEDGQRKLGAVEGGVARLRGTRRSDSAASRKSANTYALSHTHQVGQSHELTGRAICCCERLAPSHLLSHLAKAGEEVLLEAALCVGIPRPGALCERCRPPHPTPSPTPLLISNPPPPPPWPSQGAIVATMLTARLISRGETPSWRHNLLFCGLPPRDPQVMPAEPLAFPTTLVFGKQDEFYEYGQVIYSSYIEGF